MPTAPLGHRSIIFFAYPFDNIFYPQRLNHINLCSYTLRVIFRGKNDALWSYPQYQFFILNFTG